MVLCPICEKASYHPEDERQRYCARCGLFWGDMLELFQRAPGVDTIEILAEMASTIDRSAVRRWLLDAARGR